MLQHKLLAFTIHYGYVGIFGVLVLGIIGLPIPDEVLMTFAGYLIWKGKLHYFPTVLTAILGSFSGMSLSYFVGRKFGYPLLEKYGGRIHFTKEKLEHSRRWFKKFGKFALTIGCFIPGIRHVTAYFSGISKWSYRTFFIFAAPGSTIWVVTFVTLGTYLGEQWQGVIETIHRYLIITLLIAVSTGLVIWIMKWRAAKK